MRKVYNLSNKGVYKHLGRVALLLLAGIVMAALVIYLGGQSWPNESYSWVNLILLMIDVACINLLCHLGGFMDGKASKAKWALIILGVSLGAALVLWAVLIAMKIGAMVSGIIFITNLVLVALLLYKLWSMLKNMWHMLTDDLDKNANIMRFPGQFVLNQVHANDAITSPVGRVLIQGSTVLFVYVNQLKGHVLVKPNGTIDIRQEKVLKNKTTKSSKVSISELLSIAEAGCKRTMEIVEKECAARNMAVPAMRYGYAVFMPNFQRTNYVFDEDTFRRYPLAERLSSYKSYLATADQTDVFRGHACFTLNELSWMASSLCEASSQEEAAGSSGQLVADCIAKACDLVEKK